MEDAKRRRETWRVKVRRMTAATATATEVKRRELCEEDDSDSNSGSLLIGFVNVNYFQSFFLIPKLLPKKTLNTC